MTSHQPTTYSYPHTPSATVSHTSPADSSLSYQPSSQFIDFVHTPHLLFQLHKLLSKMGGNEVDGHFTIQRALEIARNSEGVVDPTVSSCLERSLREVWARLEANPDNYVLAKDEFALFNYFRHRFTNSNIAQRAVQRFWDNYQGNPRDLQTGSALAQTSQS